MKNCQLLQKSPGKEVPPRTKRGKNKPAINIAAKNAKDREEKKLGALVARIFTRGFFLHVPFSSLFLYSVFSGLYYAGKDIKKWCLGSG
jgi:hypothetical protein